nr:hypothetical protein [Tanacetum cinerariifolium]
MSSLANLICSGGGGGNAIGVGDDDDGKSDGGDYDHGKSGVAADDDGNSGGGAMQSRYDDGDAGLMGKVVILSSELDMMKNRTSTLARGAVVGK